MTNRLDAPLSRLWSEHPDVIRSFIDARPRYEQLCSEVSYILAKRLEAAAVEVSLITSRAKSLNSFADKLSHKQYDDALTEVTDLAGVRVVYLYKADRAKIESLIEEDFEVIEKVDKVDVRKADEFGYGALHYVARLGKRSSGARYDDLKVLVCEIQVRTVLQDAWAIIDHHLSYKHEADVPKMLRRKLNSLSGLFETADDQFDRIRVEREQYVQQVRSASGNPARFLAQDWNLDTFTEYLRWKFPGKDLAWNEDHPQQAFSGLQEFGVSSLSELEHLIESTAEPRAKIATEDPAPTATAEVNRALALRYPAYLAKQSGVRKSLVQLLEKHAAARDSK